MGVCLGQAPDRYVRRSARIVAARQPESVGQRGALGRVELGQIDVDLDGHGVQTEVGDGGGRLSGETFEYPGVLAGEEALGGIGKDHAGADDPGRKPDRHADDRALVAGVVPAEMTARHFGVLTEHNGSTGSHDCSGDAFIQ